MPKSAPAARAFGEALATRTGLALRLVNEHLNSAEAERLLRERGVKPEKRKALLDAAAAALILGELLEDRRAREIPVGRLG
jgi:putative Holliday junction resolvase